MEARCGAFVMSCLVRRLIVVFSGTLSRFEITPSGHMTFIQRRFNVDATS